MAKSNSKENIDDEDDIIIDEDSEVYQNGKGLDQETKETMIESLFNTKDRLVRNYKSWRGQTLTKNNSKPLGGSRFLNKQISAMGAVIDTTNGFTRKTDLECKRILHDATEAAILDMADEPTVHDNDMRTFSKMYEHSVELYLGLVEFGHGANVLRDVSAGLNTPEMKKEENKGFMGWFSRGN